MNLVSRLVKTELLSYYTVRIFKTHLRRVGMIYANTAAVSLPSQEKDTSTKNIPKPRETGAIYIYTRMNNIAVLRIVT